jgi:hypothetical protein
MILNRIGGNYSEFINNHSELMKKIRPEKVSERSIISGITDYSFGLEQVSDIRKMFI